MSHICLAQPKDLRVALGNIQERLEKLQRGLNNEDRDLDAFQIKKTAYFGQAVSPVNKENASRCKTEEEESNTCHTMSEFESIQFVEVVRPSHQPISHIPREEAPFKELPSKEQLKIPNFHATIERFHQQMNGDRKSVSPNLQKGTNQQFNRTTQSFVNNCTFKPDSKYMRPDSSFISLNHSFVQTTQNTFNNNFYHKSYTLSANKPFTKLPMKCPQTISKSLISKTPSQQIHPLAPIQENSRNNQYQQRQQPQHFQMYRNVRDISPHQMSLNSSFSGQMIRAPQMQRLQKLYK